jgi:uncharacterized membrane protein YedE/YeeE
MGRHVSVLAAGLLFGFGLALAGMTHAGKVLGFLDVAGNWDPSLLLVLTGAVIVTLAAFRLILRRPRPLFESKFKLPTAREIDASLMAGAAVFGIGWGISGYCPGPGIALLAAPGWETWVFIPAVLIGDFLHGALTRSTGGVVTTPAATDG